jgi:hypothetical protein
MGDLARDLAEAFDALAALLARLVLAPRHRHPCHAEQKARIDAVVAGLDALAAEDASIRPFTRGLRAVAGPQNVDDAGDYRRWLGIDAAGPGDRADLDAFAAARASIGHRRDACGERTFEALGHASSRYFLRDYCAAAGS